MVQSVAIHFDFESPINEPLWEEFLPVGREGRLYGSSFNNLAREEETISGCLESSQASSPRSQFLNAALSLKNDCLNYKTFQSFLPMKEDFQDRPWNIQSL
jgi:hypothetical protein